MNVHVFVSYRSSIPIRPCRSMNWLFWAVVWTQWKMLDFRFLWFQMRPPVCRGAAVRGWWRRAQWTFSSHWSVVVTAACLTWRSSNWLSVCCSTWPRWVSQGALISYISYIFENLLYSPMFWRFSNTEMPDNRDCPPIGHFRILLNKSPVASLLRFSDSVKAEIRITRRKMHWFCSIWAENSSGLSENSNYAEKMHWLWSIRLENSFVLRVYCMKNMTLLL